MRRDWDVVREILLAVERGDGNKEIDSKGLPGVDDALVAYNMWLLIEQGLAEGGGREPGTMGSPHVYIMRLRWGGHELLDHMRADTFWKRVKKVAVDKGIGLSVDGIKAIAAYVSSDLLRGG